MAHADDLATLELIERTQRVTRARLRGFWFPLVVFGTLNLVSVALRAAWDVNDFRFAAIAWPAAAIATFIYYARRWRGAGVEGPWPIYVGVLATMLVGSYAAVPLGSAAVGHRFAIAAASAVVSAGYAVYSYLERRPSLAWMAAGLVAIVVTLGLLQIDIETLARTTTALYGAVPLVAGIVIAREERASA